MVKINVLTKRLHNLTTQRVWRANNIERKRHNDRAWRKRNPDRVKAADRRWKKDNPEKAHKAVNRWHASHPERVSQNHRRYRQNSPHKLRRNSRRWRLAHPETAREWKHKRRAKEAGNGGNHTAAQWLELKALYGNRCVACGKSEAELVFLGLKLVRDHVVPIARGGTNDIGNIQPLCHGIGGCNNKKGAKTVDFRPKSVVAG